ncbi:hypothetical protein M407DRAFT_18118 [Tulasnella calospora MUT 4182]|uniref:MARVEL domain-containing protein n=1 Tax=Tulasnella calospora MUT 4182 TaxID=1051891 RepID=A0A0C3MGX6_9AGAM|nr:hypothetical protein M407DRAFT_18118 [Tulasnella calospora MUT 4182]
MLLELVSLLHPTLLGILVLCCIFIISFTAHFQSLAVGNGFGSQVPFSFTITVTLFTILGASIEGFSLYFEVTQSPAAVHVNNLLAIGEPYVEGALGLLWLAVLIVVGARQKMKLIGGCLDPSPRLYSPDPGVCSEWKACLFFVVVACLSLVVWVAINHQTKSRGLCAGFIRHLLRQRAQDRAARTAARQAAAAQAAKAVTPSAPPPSTVPPPYVAHPPAAGPFKEASEHTIASKLPNTRESSAWAPSLPFAENRDSQGVSSTSELGVLTPPASPPPSTLPPWVRTSRIEGSEDSPTISSVLTPPPMRADSTSPPAAGPNHAPV